MYGKCEICGKTFDNEPRFPTENGGEMCEDCYLELQKKTNSEREDESVWDVLENKDDYELDELEEALQWFKSNGYLDEAEEIESYLEAIENEEEEINYNGKETYKGSKSNIWVLYIKIVCDIFFVLIMLAGTIIGTMWGVFGAIIGTIIGVIVGFITIAPLMVGVTMCENISIMTDNTAKILMKLDEICERGN